MHDVDRDFLLKHGFTEDADNKFLKELFTNNKRFKEALYAGRLERIESLKAEKRMKAGKADPTQTFGEGDKHKTESSNIVAEKLGIGSGEQYRKERVAFSAFR